MKKILMIALLASFVTTASAKKTNANILVKPNVNTSSLLTNTSNKGFGGFCLQTCVNNYNYCMNHATTYNQIQGCSAKWESCSASCGFEGGPNPR